MTLVGPGGVGKTRLAVEVARAHRDRSGSPVTFVELAAVDADGVAAAVTRSLGLAEGPHPVGDVASCARRPRRSAGGRQL